MPIRHREPLETKYWILVVLELSHAQTPKAIELCHLHTEWISEDIPDEEAEALMANDTLKDFIHIDVKNPAEEPSYTGVLMHEKVIIILFLFPFTYLPSLSSR